MCGGTARLDPLAEPGQWPKLEAALAVVNRDLMATLPDQEALILMADPPWQPLPPSGMEEGDPPEPDDATTVLTVVADAAQSTITELLWCVWPICSEHKIGMHPRPAGTTDGWYQSETDAVGPPVWWCRSSREGTCHDVSMVGELDATLPEKQRRALRRSERKQDGRR